MSCGRRRRPKMPCHGRSPKDQSQRSVYGESRAPGLRPHPQKVGSEKSHLAPTLSNKPESLETSTEKPKLYGSNLGQRVGASNAGPPKPISFSRAQGQPPGLSSSTRGSWVAKHAATAKRQEIGNSIRMMGWDGMGWDGMDGWMDAASLHPSPSYTEVLHVPIASQSRDHDAYLLTRCSEGSHSSEGSSAMRRPDLKAR